MYGWFSHYTHGSAAEPFYIRPTGSATNGTDIRYGDEVKIAYTDHGYNTTNCGWYGCRVARKASVDLVDDDQLVERELMRFNHGNSAQTFYLRKTR
jgi:hypothetical protein